MTFLAGIEVRHKHAQARFGEIRRILAEAIMPGTGDYGLSCAIKLPTSVHERLEGVASRHGLRSLKEAAFKAMLLGLATMERLPAETRVPLSRAKPVLGRVLSAAEITRIKDEGFDAPRVKPPEKHYLDDDEQVRAAG